MRRIVRTSSFLGATLAVIAFLPGAARAQDFRARHYEPLACGVPGSRAEATMSFAQGQWIDGWTLSRLEFSGAMLSRSGQRFGVRLHGGQASSPASTQIVNGGGVALAFEAPIARRFSQQVMPLCLEASGRGFRYADDTGFAFHGIRLGVGIMGRVSEYFGPFRVTGQVSAGIAQGMTVWEGTDVTWNGATGYEAVPTKKNNFRPVPDIGAGVSVKAGPVVGFASIEWGEAETWPAPIWRTGFGFTF